MSASVTAQAAFMSSYCQPWPITRTASAAILIVRHRKTIAIAVAPVASGKHLNRGNYSSP